MLENTTGPDVPETDDRAGFLRRAAAAGAGLVGGGALLAALPRAAGAQGRGDVAILNFALLLEELEAAFYAEALAGGALSAPVRAFAQTVGEHEAAHVAAIRDVLGDDAIERPQFNFQGTTANEATFLATAVELEGIGVSAYKGAAPAIRSRQILAAALSIHSVEARHASWVRRLNGNRPVIASFDVPLTARQVVRRVAATGFIVEEG
jgi:rubrerythrin